VSASSESVVEASGGVVKNVTELPDRLDKEPEPTYMTRVYGEWMGRRAEAFPAAAYKHFKKLSEKR
jgi:hypothetical protein